MSPERDGSYRVTYTLLVENLGSTEIRQIGVDDNLAAAFPDVPYAIVSVESDTASVRSDYDGKVVTAILQGTDTLGARQSFTIDVAVRVTPTSPQATYSNTAVARGVDAMGAAVVDRSQDGHEVDPDWDGDPTNNDAPTAIELIPQPRLGAALQVAAFSAAAPGEYEVTLALVVENYGQTVLEAVNIQQNLGLAFSSPIQVSVVEAYSADFAVNPDFDGTTNLRLLAGTDHLAPGERGTVLVKLRVTRNEGGAWFETRVLALATAPDGTTVTDFSTAGENPDANGNGDPTDDGRATDIFLATTSLSGFAETTIRVAALPLDLDITSMLFNTSIRIDGFSGRVDAKLTNTVFDLLTFAASGPIGDLSAQSTLVFNPSTLAFVSWQTTMALDAFGVGFSDTLYLTAPAASSYNVVRISGAVEAFDLEAIVRLGVCPGQFWDTTVCADWEWNVCETPLHACLSFSGVDGFVSLELEARDIPLLANVLGPGATLDVRFGYTMDEKAVTPTLRFAPDWAVCPEIVFLGEVLLAAPPPGVDAVRIYGVKIEVPVGDVIFRVADSFSDDKNASITGKAAFFESVSLETSLVSCCGSAGRIKGSAYFERSPAPSGGLFGIGLLEGSAELLISRHVAATFTVEFRPTSPSWALTARLRTLW